MRIETRTKTVNETIYISDDGVPFNDMDSCIKHENKVNGTKRERIEHKRIKSLDNWYPYMEYVNPDCKEYFWYNIETEEELKMLNEAYCFVSDCDTELPEIICVETPDYKYYDDDCYWSTLSEMISDLNRFFDNVGYEIVRKGT